MVDVQDSVPLAAAPHPPETADTAPLLRFRDDSAYAGPIAAFADFGDIKVGTPGGLGPLTALPVALIVVAIGASLGGPTGYAINPARDLGPRIAHAILPIKGKGSSDWGYSWIPVVGPIVGGIIAGLLANPLIPILTTK